MKLSSSLIARMVLLAACWLAFMGSVRGQALTILHSFGDGSVPNDGNIPEGPLIQGTNGNFYGTTYEGGSATYYGTVFKITPQGTMTILHSFEDGSVANDGYGPLAGLIQGSDGNFYGTTYEGGNPTNGTAQGTVFKITPQGTVTILHTFQDGTVTNDGTQQKAGLIQGSDGNFYGTSLEGGSANDGTVFKITPHGTVTILHSFSDGSVTNDGSLPYADLIQASDGNFYGTTNAGGSATYYGTVFKITPQGAVTILHSFEDGSVVNDGNEALKGLIQGSDGNFYGITYSGGSAGDGTAFKITPQGLVTILHNFGDGSVTDDGINPNAGLIQGSDGNFYGTTEAGGSAGDGTVFEITPQGTVTIIHNFGDGSVTDDGLTPDSAFLQSSDGNFYGGTSSGGTANEGTVFKLVPALPNITSALGANGTLGLPFSYQITGTKTPNSFAATGLTGSGLSINANTGVISGTPTTVGTFPVTLTLTNGTGSSNFPLTITIGPLPVPSVTSILTAYGSVGAAFSYQTVATNLTTSYTATYNGSSTLPAGLSFDSTTGVLSTSSLTATGTFPISLTATNTTGPSASVTLVIQIFSSPPTPNQEYNLMHLFGDGTVPGDGANPQSIIQAFDGNFYGVTENGVGGNIGAGTVFEMTVQGVVSTFFSFGSTPVSFPKSLIQASDGNFYGSTGLNQIFKLNSSGLLTILHTFANNTQLNSPIQGSDGNFYGTTQAGGSANKGMVFKITPQGLVTILHNFGDGSVTDDGSTPYSSLVQGSDSNFYGTTSNGGTASLGTVFKITAQGTVTILHSFSDGSVANDGNDPLAGLIQGYDGNFYGTTSSGGSGGNGTVFEITPAGVLTILHNFDDGSVTNDGLGPEASLIQGLDGNFYGTTSGGGSAYAGTVFEITPSKVVTILHSFDDGSVTEDGFQPTTPLIQSSAGNFYGVTSLGGVSTDGTVYSIIPTQAPAHTPVFTGSAYAITGIYTPFSFTPKATFGVSGSGVENGNSVQPQPVAGGIEGALVSLLPQTIRKFFSATNWVLTQGTTPSTMLPNYLSFDPTSGTISGTPVTAGIYTVTMTPYNALGEGTAQTITLYIDVPPGISSPVSAICAVGSAFSYQIQTMPLATSYGATFLPSWLTVDTVGGAISGTAPAAGSYVFNAVATNVSGQTVQSVTLTVTGGPSAIPTITSPATANTSVGASFNYQIATSTAATNYSVLSLPTGLLFDEPSGTILGVPSETGTFNIPIAAANANGTYASVLSLTIAPPYAPGIASSFAATALEGSLFSYDIPSTGVVSSYAETGSLPAGVSFNASTGVLSGTPTATGIFPISITLANETGTNSGTLNLNIAMPVAFTGSPTDTPENDGVPNLLKYLYDIDPSVAMSTVDRAALPTVGTTTNGGIGYLTLTYRQYALSTGITVNVQTSPDLKNWTTVNPPNLSQQIGTDPITGDPIIEVGVLANGTNKQFIRLNVTMP